MDQEKRVVLDTNTLVSAFGWRRPPHEVLRRCVEGRLQLCLSQEILNELSRVLHYPKFGLSEVQIAELLTQVAEIGRIVDVPLKLKVIAEDPSDNMFIECALCAGADFIVSGNTHLLQLKELAGVKIVTARRLLKEID